LIVVFNSSPLIFLTKLDYINDTLTLFDRVIIPPSVSEELTVKDDFVKSTLLKLLNTGRIEIKNLELSRLRLSLKRRLGHGESDAIALAVQINADMIILDDYTARKIAMDLGLTVKGTLGIIKKLASEQRFI
jgi:predicted nucleic acid-binding protein